jgi:lysophospholipase L1-like esterase
MRYRYVLVPLVTLLVTIAGFELIARWMRLDLRQHEAIAVSAGKGLGEIWHEGDTEAWLEAVEVMGLDYAPDHFALEGAGYHSRWPFCDFGFDGPTVLAMGDSTTRQSMMENPAGGRFGDMVEHTWPMLLQQRLGDGVQVCVAAENGYHPRDLTLMLDALEPRLHPAVVLALLCENDLNDLEPRVRVDRGDAFIFYRALDHRLVFGPLFWRTLFDRSEAFRFLHWRLAMAVPSQAYEKKVELKDAFSVVSALERMDAKPGALGVYYLPQLDDSPLEDPRVEELAQKSGVDITTVPLPSPRERFRRTEEDAVHVNIDGHRAVVRAVYPLVRESLGLED